ncbi:hypothetical protein EJ04DRAFT_14034 [Polyplosphaeria fusca]|uniref:Ankyrin repeat protein n=1 Tax=Polyplosphaeria fusca TaxID=682080 RepID=A0A9P4QPD3_9PLEO|nr:hypothetical protein EJ04DRAFT_14034 [Polyplosphaeria fusca]
MSRCRRRFKGRGWTPLSYAAAHGLVAAIEMLLARAVVDAGSQSIYALTPLFFAVVNQQAAVVKIFLERTDIDLDPSNRLEQTPLFMTAVYGYIDIVEILLKTGRGLVDAIDARGTCSPIM